MFVAFDDPEEEFAFFLDLVEGCGDLCFQMPEVFFHAAEFVFKAGDGLLQLFYFLKGCFVGCGTAADVYPVFAGSVYFGGPVMVVFRGKPVDVFPDTVRHAEVYGG